MTLEVKTFNVARFPVANKAFWAELCSLRVRSYWLFQHSPGGSSLMPVWKNLAAEWNDAVLIQVCPAIKFSSATSYLCPGDWMSRIPWFTGVDIWNYNERSDAGLKSIVDSVHTPGRTAAKYIKYYSAAILEFVLVCVHQNPRPDQEVERLSLVGRDEFICSLAYLIMGPKILAWCELMQKLCDISYSENPMLWISIIFRGG